MTSYRFRPGWIVTVAALAVFPVLVGLGFWQLDRAQQKIDLRDRHQSRGEMPPLDVNAEPLEREADEFRRATATGRYRPELTVYLDNKVLDGVPGYEVLTPLALDGSRNAGRHVLVSRGWISWGESRETLPAVETPRGAVRVSGRLRAPPADYFTLEARDVDGAFTPRWQNLDLARFERVTSLKVAPLVLGLDPSSGQDAGLVRRAPEYDDPWIHRHRAYAVQWFGLALLLLVLYVVLNLEKRDRDER